MTDLSALIARVEEGSHADRTLDGEVFIALSPECQAAGRIDHMDGVVGWWPKDGPYESARPVPALTGSLDSVLSLIEQKLPAGNCYSIDKWPKLIEASVSRNCIPAGERAWLYEGTHKTSPARALLAAALRAIQSKEGPRHDA